MSNSEPKFKWRQAEAPPPVIITRVMSDHRRFAVHLYDNRGEWYEYFPDPEEELKLTAQFTQMGIICVTRTVEGIKRYWCIWLMNISPMEYAKLDYHAQRRLLEIARKNRDKLIGPKSVTEWI